MTDESYFGHRGVPDTAGDVNALRFLIRQMLAQTHTAMPVKIMAVHGGGPGNRPPTVDVLPLVNQVDGVGKQKPHGVVYGIPVHRSQAGSGGIVVDPVAGDVGLMTVAQRDISAVKANDGEQSNPGSRRMHDFADGVYHGPMLNVPLTHYIHVKPDQSIDIVAPAGVTINGLKIDASGNLTTPGGVTAGLGTGDAVTLQQHVHRGVVLGPADTAPPLPGT
jgi:hypothetical protein